MVDGADRWYSPSAVGSKKLSGLLILQSNLCDSLVDLSEEPDRGKEQQASQKIRENCLTVRSVFLEKFHVK
jgi:hypothetical protein